MLARYSLLRRTLRLGGVVVVVALCLVATTGASGSRSRSDYRYFRALSVDLVGRPPSRDELAAFERSDFDLDAWLDAHLTGPSYAERIRRIYLDLLRLDLPPTVKFEPPSILLLRGQVLDPSGKLVDVYFRAAQRRTKPEIDGWFCFSQAEMGPPGKLTPIPQSLFDLRTVAVKPWWLYADYRAAKPHDLISGDWYRRFPGYGFYLRMILDAGGQRPASVRVCREETQTTELGHVYVTGRIVTKKDVLLPGRTARLPADTGFAKAHKGGTVSCSTLAGYQSSTECGCGVGLERCMTYDPNRFILPTPDPLDESTPFVTGYGTAMMWMKQWWTEEPRHFIDKIVTEDRDIRELLTSRGTVINGPLAQFYRSLAGATCCGGGADLGYVEPDALFDPKRVPASLIPEDASTWTWVADRGPHAAGLMTMPVFLLKYGSRRARAHAIYNAFLCKDFVAATAKLVPSAEPDLTKRPGCRSCHIRLEPLAAYFSRIVESDWTYLPASVFPVQSERCATADPLHMSGACNGFYDPAFTDRDHATLRGARASASNADEGPAGLASEIVSSPEFSRCVVKNIAQSLLGRPLGADDDEWADDLEHAFVAGGYRLRGLVRTILTSPRYKAAGERILEAP